jgi:predicted O-methyltransferase YrrM
MDSCGIDTDEGWDRFASQCRALAKMEENRERLAALLAEVMPSFAIRPHYQQYFELWEQHGFHLTPADYGQPIPHTRSLDDRLWQTASELPGIAMNEHLQCQLLEEIFPQYQEEYSQFPLAPTECPHAFYFENGRFSGTDALVLYCMIRHFRPNRIIEVGAGFSSRLSAQALVANGHGELICIEPYPDEVIGRGFPGLSKLIQEKVQNLGPAFFEQLGSGDVLFIDSSHIVKVGGDVDFLFLEVLPRLRPGVLVHVHDVFFPYPGRKSFYVQDRRFWTEQALQAFLIFNRTYEVLFCNSYLSSRHLQRMRDVFPRSPWHGGGSFWMRRVGE